MLEYDGLMDLDEWLELQTKEVSNDLCSSVIDLPRYPGNPNQLTNEILNKTVSEATLFEKNLSAGTWGEDFLTARFFGQEAASYKITYYSKMESNNFRYALMQACDKNKIKLYSLTTQAALQPLIINASGATANVPSEGYFVIVPVIDGQPSSVRTEACLLQIELYKSSFVYTFQAVTYAHIRYMTSLLAAIASQNHLYKNKVFKNNGDFVKIKESTSLSDIVLLPTLKEVLVDNVINFLQVKGPLLQSAGLPSKRGIILEGPPGTGKSFTCRILAAEAKITTCIISSVADGDEIAYLYKFLRQLAPVLIIFEDIDIYLFDRNSGDVKLSTLLNELDGIAEVNNNVVTILTTNKIDVLDTAVKDRPGRFDRVIKLDYPTKDVAISMLKKFTEKYDTTNVNFEEFVAYIGNRKLSGAHYKEIVITACMAYIDAHDTELKQHLDNVFPYIKFSTADFTKAFDKLTANSNKVKGRAGFQ